MNPVTATPTSTGTNTASTPAATSDLNTPSQQKLSKYQKIGDSTFAKIDKINAELLIMTYGSLVTQLLRDYEDAEEVNKQLEKIGYKMGLRLVDEFFSKSNMDLCTDFKDTAEAIAKIGLKMFLGISNAQVYNFQAPPNSQSTPSTPTSNAPDFGFTPLQSFSIVFDDNPLNDFVELPDELKSKLLYSNILCGVIRGCLEVVQMKCDVQYVRDQLRGEEINEIKVTLKEYLKESVPQDDD